MAAFDSATARVATRSDWIALDEHRACLADAEQTIDRLEGEIGTLRRQLTQRRRPRVLARPCHRGRRPIAPAPA